MPLSSAFLRGHALILKKLERLASRGDDVHIQGAGKIENQQAVAGILCVDGDGGGGIEGMVREYGRVDGIAQCVKIRRHRRVSGGL